MRLAVHAASDGPRAGLLADDGLWDAAELLGHPEPIRDLAELITVATPVAERLSTARRTGRPVPPDELRLLTPLRRPPSIRDHIAFEEHATRTYTREIAPVWYRRPIHYYSNPSRLIGPDEPVVMPATEKLDYELEIAIVIESAGSDVAAADGLEHVLGFTILNDWSARDLQFDEMAFGLGPAKGKDFATTLGPWVVTTDELRERLADGVLDARCQVRVNGAGWADSNAKAQYHSWGAIIEHASQDSRIVPGDVLASGTVSGCSIGEALRKGVPGARYLVPGDRVELEVEGLGRLANPVVANPRPDRARYRVPDEEHR